MSFNKNVFDMNEADKCHIVLKKKMHFFYFLPFHKKKETFSKKNKNRLPEVFFVNVHGHYDFFNV